MKYKISLSGRGGECYLFPITKEQYNFFVENEVEQDSMDLESVQEYLGIEDISESELVITGPYLDELYLTVIDEEGNEIFKSGETDIDEKWIGTEYDKSNFIVIEDNIKGDFSTFELETEKEFNINNLTLVVSNISDSREIVSSILYDNKELEKDWSDYWSKGFYFFLSYLVD